MKDLLSSRGFWVLVSTVLGTLAAQFPGLAPYIQIAMPIVFAIAGFFGVSLERKVMDKPASYRAAQRIGDARAYLKSKGV